MPFKWGRAFADSLMTHFIVKKTNTHCTRYYHYYDNVYSCNINIYRM